MIYKGSEKQKDIYIGSTKIGKVYKGSTLVYQSKLPGGIVLFESGTPGTYTINVEANCTIHIDMCGAGGAGKDNVLTTSKTGGSGGYIYGNTELTKGTYTIVVGAANGGASSFIGNIAYGGSSANKDSDGAGGITTVISSGLVGSNGVTGSTASRILSYGGGGGWKSDNGQNGYCKIVTV